MRGLSTSIHPTGSEDLLQKLRDAKPGQSFCEAVLIGADLRGLNLSMLDLSSADLSRADLSGAQLVGTNLQGAVLHQAKLCGTELAGANLKGCNLSEADATRAGLGQVDLSQAIAIGANFEHASLIEAELTGADFRGANFGSARLSRAVLLEANFARAELVDANLDSVRLDHAEFGDADLRRCRFRGAHGFETANFVHADIFEIDFCGAYLMRRYIMDQNYLHEFRTQNRASAIWYWLWWVTSDCGRSLPRWAGWTLALTALFGYLYHFLGIDYGAHETPLSPYYFSLVTLTTLGFGDVLPATLTAQVVVMCEVVLGYLMLGGLLSLFASKMGRRSE